MVLAVLKGYIRDALQTTRKKCLQSNSTIVVAQHDCQCHSRWRKLTHNCLNYRTDKSQHSMLTLERSVVFLTLFSDLTFSATRTRTYIRNASIELTTKQILKMRCGHQNQMPYFNISMSIFHGHLWIEQWRSRLLPAAISIHSKSHFSISIFTLRVYLYVYNAFMRLHTVPLECQSLQKHSKYDTRYDHIINN